MEKLFNLKYCDICGKDFIVPDSGTYAWKKHDAKRMNYFCSYTCHRKFVNAYEAKLYQRGKNGRKKDRGKDSVE